MIRGPRAGSGAPKSFGPRLFFVHTAFVDVRLQLERIRRRVQLSAVELELQPEAFQATEELRIASGELASVIEEIASRSEARTWARERSPVFSPDMASQNGVSVRAWHLSR